MIFPLYGQYEMRKILFVDNDEKVIRKLKKQLHPMRFEWDMEFAGSGRDALNLMEKASFDVVVSDMHMPDMDVVKLFDMIMKCYPGTVRIMHSENSDRAMTMSVVRCTHQFLMKPCDAEIMKYTIERTCKLQDLLKNKKLIETVTGIKNLPSLPRLYYLITREMQSPEPSLARVGYLISQDVSLSAKILQLVNSAYFGLPQKIINPQQATVYLGAETVKALVLSNHVFSSFTEEADSLDFPIAEMWRHSLMVGMLAGEIARAELAEKEVVEGALIAGLLHDIGKLILLKVRNKYREVMDFIEQVGSDLVEAEYAVLETSHAEMGAYLLGLWGIPDSIVEIVAFHHKPSALIENVFVIMNNPSARTRDKTTPTGGILKSRSTGKFLKGLTALTAVHAANALIMQKDCSADTTTFPYVDMLYLRTLGLTDRLPEWVVCYKKVTMEKA
jgi:putative nucleotidyltransferase with HDIG domain